VRVYQLLGVRAMHPFLCDPSVGGFAGGEPLQGLTALGREVIREMEQSRVLIDLAHANDRTFRDVMQRVSRPVMDSHTACRALVNIERNRSDDQLRAIARMGGVIGVHFSSPFLKTFTSEEMAPRRRALEKGRRRMAALRRRYRDPYEYLSKRMDPAIWPRILGGAREDGSVIHRASISQLIDHLAHMVEVAGINHVGIGSDYDLGNICGGVETADKLPNLTRSLKARGFHNEEIWKLQCGNFLRLFRQILPEG
jgi:membrane dipeptidase